MSSLTPSDRQRRADQTEQRASDADRDRVAAVLGEALATGRLTSVEHADRLEAAYTAVTLGDLLPLTRDLPDDLPAQATLPGQERQEIAAVFSKVTRKGRWVPGRHTLLRSTFGALIVDLTDAVFPGREVTFELHATYSKLIIRIPANAHLVDEGGTLFSKRHVSGDALPARTDPPGPLIRITGNATFSKVVIARSDEIPHWHW